MTDTMDDKEGRAANTIEDDLNTTAPQSETEVWKMPEPVFRRTSGKLPQGYLHDGFETVPSSKRPVAPEEPAVQPAAAPAPESTPLVRPKSGTLKMLLVLLGVAAMIAFLVVFLTAIYFFFLRPAE